MLQLLYLPWFDNILCRYAVELYNIIYNLLTVGDITQKGYEKKRTKLLAPYKLKSVASHHG